MCAPTLIRLKLHPERPFTLTLVHHAKRTVYGVTVAGGIIIIRHLSMSQPLMIARHRKGSAPALRHCLKRRQRSRQLRGGGGGGMVDDAGGGGGGGGGGTVVAALKSSADLTAALTCINAALTTVNAT